MKFRPLLSSIRFLVFTVSSCLAMPILLGGCATKAMIQRARGTAIEKHGVAGTVQTNPSPWHYALVPFAGVVDVILSPLQVAALVGGLDDEEAQEKPVPRIVTPPTTQRE